MESESCYYHLNIDSIVITTFNHRVSMHNINLLPTPPSYIALLPLHFCEVFLYLLGSSSKEWPSLTICLLILLSWILTLCILFSHISSSFLDLSVSFLSSMLSSSSSSFPFWSSQVRLSLVTEGPARIQEQQGFILGGGGGAPWDFILPLHQ